MTADLITRLESADGPDRELDWAIAESLGWTRRQVGQVIACYAPGDPHMKAGAPRYTASTDAALTLVPEGWDWELYPREAALIHPNIPGADVFGDATTPALALCIAALRAQQKDTNA